MRASAGVIHAYRAVRRDGTVELGVIDAASREDALALLTERGLYPLDVAVREDTRSARGALPIGDLALGLRVLADLIEADLPLARALAALEELAPASWERVIPSVRGAVREGKPLASALALAPAELPMIVLGVIQAGEAGSGLALAVRRAAEITEEAAATRAAIRGAMAYPAILAVAGAASIGLLVGVVLPRFAAILADLGQAIPASTRLVLQTATLARAAFLPGIVVLVVLGIAWRSWTATPDGQRRWHQLLLAIPLVGTTRRAAAVSRIAAALAALLDGGVPISRALAHATSAAGDAALAGRLYSAREAVLHGARLSWALAEHDAATPTLVRLVRAGEESGRLAGMLAHGARLERERAMQLTRGAVRLLEPALIVAFGGAIALVAAALLQAVYSVRPGT